VWLTSTAVLQQARDKRFSNRFVVIDITPSSASFCTTARALQ